MTAFWLMAGAAILVAVSALAFRQLLWPLPIQGYPWGSDTWGHLLKAQFLLEEMVVGNPFPRFFPYWYNGIEPFRYWAPLPYYLLALAGHVAGDMFLGWGWLAAILSLTGGLGWLLFHRRFGILWAVAAGLVWMLWPDHIRVAMAEGNVPRVAATALFPYLFYFFLEAIERSQRRVRDAAVPMVCLSIVASVLVLSHAMMAAAFMVVLAVMGILWAAFGDVRMRQLAAAVAFLALGIGLACWWLVPGLEGGITAVNPAAVSESIDHFPLTISLHPWLRASNHEVFYWGASLIPLALWVLLTWRDRTSAARASLITGLLLVLITTTAARTVYSLLPLHHLLWPLRLATAGPAMFLAAAFMQPLRETSRVRMSHFVLGAVVLVLLVADSVPSLAMVDTRSIPHVMEAVAEELDHPGGWRVATLDLSTFGSVASYLLTARSSREQVFGWAWQGAETGPNIVLLNTALERGYYQLLLDRLREMGATHLVVRPDLVKGPGFLAAAEAQGYSLSWGSDDVMVLRLGTGIPYALRTSYQALVIGRYAPNWACLFPSVEIGRSIYVDHYSLSELLRYDTVILSGAVWYQRNQAEELALAVVESGRRLVVDMEGLPEDVLSRRPSFLGVAGEPVFLYRVPEALDGSGQPVHLQPFDREHHPWRALVPQGADRIDHKFFYYEETAALTARSAMADNEVWFLGANLPYHAYMTGDPAAISILEEVTGLEAGALPRRDEVALESYRADAMGYEFQLEIPASWGRGLVTIPVAARDNTQVLVNGVDTIVHRRHNLLALDLPPGLYEVEVTVTQPRSLLAGATASLVSGGLLISFAIWGPLLSLRRGRGRNLDVA